MSKLLAILCQILLFVATNVAVVFAAPREPGLCRNLFDTRSTWSAFSKEAHDLLYENIAGNNLKDEYGSNVYREIIHEAYKAQKTSHVRILRDVFGITFTADPNIPSVSTLLSKYESYMKRLIHRKVVSSEEVLWPVFISKNSEGKFYWSRFDEPIPEGFKPYTDILPNEVYNQVIKQGFFPMGLEKLTPTSISAFEHDLAHLTSFISYPKYMALTKKLAEIEPVEFDGRYMRGYYWGEGLTLIKPSAKRLLSSHMALSKEMRERLSDITYPEMVNYLKTRPIEELHKITLKLEDNFEKYFDIYGGAARDPVSNNSNRLHSPFRAMIFMASFSISPYLFRDEKNVETLARLQIILIKLSNTKLEDWFEAINQSHVDPRSPIGQLFADKTLWDGIRDDTSSYQSGIVLHHDY